MVRRDAEADKPPRRRQPLDHVHFDRNVGVEERAGGVEPGRPGPNDGYAERLIHTRSLRRAVRSAAEASLTSGLLKKRVALPRSLTAKAA
jgi:hypothetical protein